MFYGEDAHHAYTSPDSGVWLVWNSGDVLLQCIEVCTISRHRCLLNSPMSSPNIISIFSAAIDYMSLDNENVWQKQNPRNPRNPSPAQNHRDEVLLGSVSPLTWYDCCFIRLNVPLLGWCWQWGEWTNTLCGMEYTVNRYRFVWTVGPHHIPILKHFLLLVTIIH